MRTLESHSSLLFLASEKSKIEDGLHNHLDKLLKVNFSPKSLFLAFREDLESLLELLCGMD